MKQRIINGLDEPIPVEIAPAPMYSPYGRAVIVIQQPGMAMNQNQINSAYMNNLQNNGAHIPGTSKGYWIWNLLININIYIYIFLN